MSKCVHRGAKRPPVRRKTAEQCRAAVKMDSSAPGSGLKGMDVWANGDGSTPGVLVLSGLCTGVDHGALTRKWRKTNVSRRKET